MQSFQLHLPLILVLLATEVGLLTTAYGLYYIDKFGRTKQVTTFTALAAAITVWVFFALLQLTATTYRLSYWAYKLLHFGSFTTAPAVLLYALSMGNARRWVNRKTVSVIGVGLLPVFVLLFTDPVPVLFEDPRLVSFGAFSVISHGESPIYVAYLSAFYIVATAGLSYIVYRTWTDSSLSRRQTAVLVPAIFAPMLLSVVQTFDILPFETPGTILTPASFSIGMAGVGYAAFRYETFDTKALARSRAIETMREGYLLVDTGGEIIDVNARARSLLDAETALVGTKISELFAEPDGQALEAGDDAPPFEVAVDGPDGDTRTLEVSTSKFTTSSEQTLGTLFVVREITARKRAQEQVKRQRDNIAVLDQMVRHDIRNHLQSVLGGADLLATKAEMTDDEARYLEMITENADHAVDLTKSARELATVMLEPESEFEPVNVRAVLTDEIEKVSDSFDSVSIAAEGSIPNVSVTGDEMLGSVFRNLLKNAVQHNDTEQPEVVVSATERDDRVRVSIADNGPGIPDVHKEQLFSKGETGLDSEGTGIGLYLVRTLVERYGGSVSVEDNEPRGSIFTVSLPRAESS
ncbi:Signal transduction histidine kinase, contains PAS domain [Halapricum desulfuricans]|uniref:Signal transduction histidine kinase, contains PAS domain n=1 Tax=Halapricum desulfuricans TaxID=2841257 RepID=A0A897NIL2_9EURY|nr:histidine kinase N-terminal 7TM domain-containing protein [Halapricum desulfuricans]QSG12587.1 Signal transduction histidine kinase, contains PAS domain [Halapricum desulfuricans]